MQILVNVMNSKAKTENLHTARRYEDVSAKFKVETLDLEFLRGEIPPELWVGKHQEKRGLRWY